MKIAITGSTGFIGQHLLKVLFNNEQYTIIPLDRNKGFDITNMETLKNLESEVDYIIHLAAKTFTPDSYKHARDFIEVNAQGTANVLELARIKKARLLYVSSYVYGPPKYLPIDEKHPVDMFNPYSASKLLGEQMCQLYATSLDVPVVIIRPFNVYGPGHGDHFLLPKIIQQAKTGEVSLIDPRPKRDYIYISDLVSLIIKAVEHKFETPIETFNAGTGKSHSIHELVETIKNTGLIDTDFKVRFSHEYRVNEVLDTVASIEKAKNELGWEPKITLEQGITLMIKKMKAMGV